MTISCRPNGKLPNHYQSSNPGSLTAVLHRFLQIVCPGPAAAPDIRSRSSGKKQGWALAFLLTVIAAHANAQTPTVGLSGLPATPLIGEEVCVDASFTNASSDTGFGPYLVVALGPELADIRADFVDIAPLIEEIGTFDSSGTLTDPISGNVISGTEGGKAWVIRYPVGSSDLGQPPLVMTICTAPVTGAEIGTDRDFTVVPGFEFGDTTVGTGGSLTGSAVSGTVTPQLARVEKTNSAPEGERPPGPSHPFLYSWNVDVSEGVQLDNVELSDTLPAGIQWTGDPITLSAPLGVGCAVSMNPTPPPTPGGTAIVSCASVLGSAAADDIAVGIPVYIADILDETGPDNQLLSNTVDFVYDFEGTSFADASTSNIEALLAAVQKSVSGTGLPGGTLTYSINFQLTDFPTTPAGAGANTFVITDIIPDGLGFDTTIALVVDGTIVPITPSVSAGPGPGETTLTWDIADAVGGTLTNGANGALTFRANVLTNYANGDPVLASDVFTNSPNLSFSLTEGGSGTDSSFVEQAIDPNVSEKAFFSPDPVPAALEPGEEVIFELSMSIPAGNTADVVFIDFLPRPVFRVTDFNAATDVEVLPPFDALSPAISTNASDNSVRIDFGDVNAASASVLAVRLSARLVGDPFADSLFLTNLLQTSYTNTNGTTITDLQAVGATVGAPSLEITKGVIAADNPGASIVPAAPADPTLATAEGDVSGVDAADQITFLITVENVGSTEAFNVTLDDVADPVYSCAEPGPSDIVNGNGTTLGFSGSLSTGLRLNDPLQENDGAPGAPYAADTAFVTVRCTLSAAVEPRESYENESGVTWTSVPDPSLPFPRVSDVARAVIADPQISKRIVGIFPGYRGGALEAHIGELLTYEVVITIPEGTSSRVRVQDILQSGLAAVDVLSITASSPAVSTSIGSFSDVIANAGFNSQGGGVTAPDRRLVFGPGNNDNGFGTITNSDTNNSTVETITLRYRARVLNASVNQQGRRRQNQARWLWQPDGAGRRNVQVRADRVRILEPSLQFAKSLSPDQGDIGSPPRVTLDFSHQRGSRTDAFDVTLTDTLPGNLFVDGPVDTGACSTLPDTFAVTSGVGSDSFTAVWSEFPLGATCTISFQTRFGVNPLAGQVFTNCAQLDWESLRDSDQPLLAPPNNTLGFERTGSTSDPGQLNDYFVEACDTFSVFGVGISKDLLSTDQPQTDGIAGTPAGFESLTIGELAVFELVITIPDANVTELRVTDLLPVTDNVLELVSASTTSIGSDLTAANPNPPPVLSDRDSDGVVDSVLLNFGAVTQAADGTTDEDDRIRIQIQARVKDRLVNENNDRTVNDAVIRFDGLTASDRFELEVVEPALLLEKTGDRTEAEAGDPITYTLRIEHAAGSRVDAQDLELSDPVPDALNVVPGSVGLGDVCTGTPSAGPTLSAGAITASWDSLALGDVCEIEFQAVVDVSAVTGEAIVNEAEINYSSYSGTANPDDRSYRARDRWLINISEPGLAKALTATDVDATEFIVGAPSQQLTIGETATFTLTAQFSDGTTENVVVRDQLPVTDVELQIVASRIASIGADLSLTGGVIVGSAGIDCSTSPPQDCVEWSLGNVVNLPDARPDPDADDSVVFEVEALVLDSSENSGVPGEDKNLLNRSTLRSSGVNLVATESFDLVEPLLELAKLSASGVLPAVVEATGVQPFTLVLRHAANSTATATDVVLTDTLDAEIEWIDDSTVSSDCPGFSIASSPAPGTSGTVEFTLDEFSLATGTCEIGYSVQGSAGLSVPGEFPNTASLTWYSALSANPESRRGDDLAANSLISFNDTAISKVITGTSVPGSGQSQLNPGVIDLAIGERVSYQLVSTFDEGTTSSVILQDTLQALAPDGPSLEYLSASVVFIGDDVFTTNPGTPVLGPANVVTLDFGDVTNAPTSSAMITDENDTIVVELVARVVDVTNNVSGVTLDNDVELTFSGGSSDSNVSIEIVEPILSVDKQFLDLSDGVATIEVTLGNSGNADGYELGFSDEFDESLWVAGSLEVLTLPAGFTLVESSTAGVTTVTLQTLGDPSRPEEVLAPGEMLTVVFSMAVQDGGIAGVTRIDNTVTATTTSLPGTDPAERTYSASDTDSLFFPELSLEKVWSGPNTPALPGDVLTFTLTLENSGEAPATDVQISDSPALFAALEVGSVTATSPGAINTGNSPGDTTIDVSYTSIAPAAVVTVTYEVRVPLPYPDGTTQPEELTNQAEADAKEQRDIVSDDPGTADPADPTIVPIVADPIMTVSKDDQVSGTSPGDRITYRIVYGNAGNQNATGVVLTDTVPANTVFDASASSAGWSCPSGSGAGAVCNLAVGDVPVGSGEALFAVIVDNPLPPGVTTIGNTVSVTDDGVEFDAGAPVVPSTANASETTPISGAFPELRIEKDDGGTSVTPGQSYGYDLNYRNIGTRGATGLVITETVPTGVLFNAAASLPSVWSCPDGSGAGTVCTLFIPLLLGGESGDARFALDVLFPAEAGQNGIVNFVSIVDDGTNSVTPAGDDDSDDTPLNAVPDIFVEKSPSVTSAAPGGAIVYTVDYGNRGNQNATGVLVQETVPEGSRFNAPSSEPTDWSCANGDPAGTVCTFAGGALAAGVTESLLFAIDVVDTPIDREILNQVEARDDGSNGADPTPPDNFFSVSVPFPTESIDTMSRAGLLVMALLVAWLGARQRSSVRRR